eukprot:scaffold88981_cov32-Tisochrysis_lutea.AAC.9
MAPLKGNFGHGKAQGQTLVSRYTLGEEIGRGASGLVYKVREREGEAGEGGGREGRQRHARFSTASHFLSRSFPLFPSCTRMRMHTATNLPTSLEEAGWGAREGGAEGLFERSLDHSMDHSLPGGLLLLILRVALILACQPASAGPQHPDGRHGGNQAGDAARRLQGAAQSASAGDQLAQAAHQSLHCGVH